MSRIKEIYNKANVFKFCCFLISTSLLVSTDKHKVWVCGTYRTNVSIPHGEDFFVLVHNIKINWSTISESITSKNVLVDSSL